jgi:hypothetical protein
MGFIIFLIAVVVICILAKSGMSTEIQKSKSIKDIVQAISYGRVHPYYTGMSLNDVKYTVRRLHTNTEEFESHLSMYELIGRVPSVEIPKFPSVYIERINLGFNRNNKVYSITIYIKNSNTNTKELLKEVSEKLGKPMSVSNEFVIWRNGNLVINVSKEGSISVIDEKLMGY